MGNTLKGFNKNPMVERTYNIWRAMLRRNSIKWKGGWHHSEGIYKDVTVCENWLGRDGFRNFVADVGFCPSENHSINRINGHKCYEKGFVEWATLSEQKYDTKLQTNNKSGVRGVYLDKRHGWLAYIRRGDYRKVIYAKDSYVDAVRSRVLLELEVFGKSKTIIDYHKFGLNEIMIENGMSEGIFEDIIKELE